MTDDQIKHMVNRFLAWKLPNDFNPDGGIKFDKYGNIGTEYQYAHQPTGTNLFDATQAKEMICYILEGIPSSQTVEPEPEPMSTEDLPPWTGDD